MSSSTCHIRKEGAPACPTTGLGQKWHTRARERERESEEREREREREREGEREREIHALGLVWGPPRSPFMS